MKAKEYSEGVGGLASHAGTGFSLVSALFDPTGLSILTLVGSIAGSSGAELIARDERIGWEKHYCPALDAALLSQKKALEQVTGMEKKMHVKNHFGPIVNNIDCLERTTKEHCEMPVQREDPVLKNQRLCRMKKLKAEEEEEDHTEHGDHGDHGEEDIDEDCKKKKSSRSKHDNIDVGSCYWNVNPADSGEEGVERCSACPYAYNYYREGVPGFLTPTEEGINRCKNHKSPNGLVCRFRKGVFKDECCAQIKDKDGNKKINNELCY
jgi:hypothetical protein